MPVVPADLILPPDGTGELDPAWWAAGVLESDLLPVWIDAGEAQVPAGATTAQADAVTIAYAYGTAYDNKALAMSVAPNSVGIDKGDINVSFSKDQRDRIAARATYWWGLFGAAVAEATPAVDVAYNPPRTSSSVQAVVSF